MKKYEVLFIFGIVLVLIWFITWLLYVAFELVLLLVISLSFGVGAGFTLRLAVKLQESDRW